MKLTILGAVAVASLALTLPAEAQDRGLGNGKSTLAELVAKSGGDFDKRWFDYDILLTAVKTAGLVDALNDPDLDATLFAPNDLAFIRLARDLGYDGYDEAGTWDFLVDTLTTLGGGDPIPVLTDILLYHVAPTSLSPLQVIFAGSIPTLQGGTIEPLFLTLRDKEPDLKDPILTLPLNVKASNGVLHSINRVLIPADL
jgi:serralysin